MQQCAGMATCNKAIGIQSWRNSFRHVKVSVIEVAYELYSLQPKS